jgi:hypothetical protein
LDVPVIGSGDDKIAILMYIPSGLPSDVSIYLRGTKVTSVEYPTYSTIDWGDGSNTIASGSSTSSSSDDYIQPQNHTYNYEDLPADSEFIRYGQTCRQALIEIDNSVSGCSYLDLSELTINNVYQNYDSYTNNAQSSRALDIHIASQNLQDLLLLGTVYHKDLERLKIDTPQSINTCSNLFAQMWSLRDLTFPSGLTSVATSLQNMFSECHVLESVPMMDLSSCTSLRAAFNSCFNLTEVPLLDTSSVTNFINVFTSCHSLESIPSFDYSNGTSFNGAFQNMKKIKTLPSGLDFSSAGTINLMFQSCGNLVSVPENFFDTLGNVTNSESTFAYCYSLKRLPKINLPNTTTMRTFAINCESLEEIKIGDISSITTNGNGLYAAFAYCYNNRKVTFDYPEDINAVAVHQMFSANRSLKELPYFNTSYATNLSQLFEGCTSAVTAPSYDLSSATSTLSMFFSCRSLKSIGPLRNVSTNIGNGYWMFRSCDSLEEIPSGILDSSGTSPSNFFNGLYPGGRIRKIPTLNLSGTDNARAAFLQMGDLREVGEITFNSGVDCYQLFKDCSSLNQVGYADASLVSNFTEAFYGCTSLEKCEVSGIPVSTSFFNCLLGSGAIENIFNNLASGVTSQTIDIRQNYGVSQLHSDTLAIATSKGWTVTT